MKNCKALYSLLVLALLICLSACSGSKNASSSLDKDINTIKSAQVDPNSFETEEVHLSLAQYLKRLPGVTVQRTANGTELRIRGGQGNRAFGGEPLYVLDGQPISNNYNEIETIVHVANIDKVTVLRDVSETSFYGARGQNGVIEIKTKSGN